MFNLDPLILSLGVALGIGLLIGVERERRKGTGPQRSAAGLRTFALASLTGALSFIVGGALLLAVVTAGIFGLAALAYWREITEHPGLTTEIALVSSTLLGGLAVTRPGLAAGIAAAIAILLNARTTLHRFARSVLSEDEIRDGLIFAAATLIVLPLLPNQPMGPFGALNPHAIWIIVILVMAISAAGHILVRLLGADFGLPITGFASGFISSAATVGAMGARAAATPNLLQPAAAGAILSSIATIIQMALVLAVTNTEVLRAVAIPLAFAGAAADFYGVAFAFLVWRQPSGSITEPGRAFSAWAAMAFAATLAAVLLVARASDEWFGQSGIIVAATLAGFADAHSAAISVATVAGAGKIASSSAALPILLALSTNTITKIAFSIFAGGFKFALRVVPGLALMILAAWMGWWWQGRLL
ncbi:MAG TPA: DUF4010 domain-containing protein [Methylocella sp.]|nr:DUF4010 domain-containing protein [Methylocella sp.]